MFVTFCCRDVSHYIVLQTDLNSCEKSCVSVKLHKNKLLHVTKPLMFDRIEVSCIEKKTGSSLVLFYTLTPFKAHIREL